MKIREFYNFVRRYNKSKDPRRASVKAVKTWIARGLPVFDEG